MASGNLDAYIISDCDAHGSEYVGEHFRSRSYLTGFTGSAGTAVITMEEALLWTDGRYFIQAEAELKGSGILLMKSGEEGVPKIPAYLCGYAEKKAKSKGGAGANGETGKKADGRLIIGFAGDGLTVAFLKEIEESLKEKEFEAEFMSGDLLDGIWKDRPVFAPKRISVMDEGIAGLSRTKKLELVRERLPETGAGLFLVSALDENAWLFNIRGEDIKYCPLAYSFGIITKDKAYLYINDSKNFEYAESLNAEGIEIREYADIYTDLSREFAGLKKAADPDSLCAGLYGKAEVMTVSPVKLLKAVKNETEINGMRAAHIRDGAAVTKVIYRLKHMTKDELTALKETDVCRMYEEARAQCADYICDSFAPIVAAGSNGAIVHYDPQKGGDSFLVYNSFLLMDTGAHYRYGTTDITRTVVLGEADDEMKKHFTLVLKGNLNLAAAVLRKGVTGAGIDCIARQPLWREGLDYKHGTGHGVGFVMNVHEGPNAIRTREGSCQAFEAGMITSDEPGLYLEGRYGIRLENLILCEERGKDFLGFAPLTMVPFDMDAVDMKYLNDEDIRQLAAYQKMAADSIRDLLDEDERNWISGLVPNV